MGPQQILKLRVWVNTEVMAMNEYSTFPIAPGLEPQPQMQFCVRTFIGVGVGEDLTPM